MTIINGSDVGAFAHGELGRELELMVDFGMTPVQALKAATSTASEVLGLGEKVGTIKPGLEGRHRRQASRATQKTREDRQRPQGQARDEGRRDPPPALNQRTGEMDRTVAIVPSAG